MPICPKCRGENPELGAKCPRDGYYYVYDDAVEDAAKDDWIGRLAADKYVILGLISEGGMGAVYRAMQLPVQREVAFKVLRAELQDSDQGHDRFAREARAVSKLTHPNIITMHDFGVDDDGHPFMVMEYAPGKSLTDWMSQPGLDIERICHVFRQILSALSEAHHQGIIHRDLKPENLIVTKTGSDSDYIKLLDFGIARMVHDGATRGLTREGEVFGTPHYMAPEQAQGKKDIGPPADVYALGIMLYEMISGDCPFDAPTPLSILYMHINDNLPALVPRAGISLPESLREVVETATAKESAVRYANAGEMLEAFDRALGTASGIYTAPAGVSPEHLHHTQNMGAQGHIQQGHVQQGPIQQEQAERATAETLHLDGSSNQRVTGTSNGVPVHDPKKPSSQSSGNTTFELEALQPSNGTKLLLVGAVIAILLGVGAAFVLTGDDGGDPVTGDAQKTATQQGDEDPNAVAEDEAPAENGSESGSEPTPAEETAEVAAANDEPTPAEEKPSDEESAAAALAEANEEPATPRAEHDEPEETAAKQAQPAASDSKPADSKPADDKPTKAPSQEQAPAPDTKTTKTTVAADEKSDDEPRKFQPKKFRPKPTPTDDETDDETDDGPKKFEPKKWR